MQTITVSNNKIATAAVYFDLTLLRPCAAATNIRRYGNALYY